MRLLDPGRGLSWEICWEEHSVLLLLALKHIFLKVEHTVYWTLFRHTQEFAKLLLIWLLIWRWQQETLFFLLLQGVLMVIVENLSHIVYWLTGEGGLGEADW